MSKLLIPYGFKDGRYFSPFEVENGDHCGCICPGCEKHLRANHGKGRKRPYFSHQTNAECTAGYETAVHKVAKQIIQDEGLAYLPEHIISFPSLLLPSGRSFTREPLVISGHSPAFELVELEKTVHPYRPDITAHTSTDVIYIEIFVTNSTSYEKSNHFKHSNLVEIDLSQAERDVVFDLERFKELVLHQASRKWIHCSLYDDRKNRALESFHSEFEKQKKQEIDRLEARRRSQEQFNKNREKAREPYLEALTELSQVMTNEGLQHRVSNLKRESGETLAKAKAFLGFHQGWPDPIGYCTVHCWIFNTHWIVWQAYIYANYVKGKTRGTVVDAFKVKKDVVERYGVMDCVFSLNNAKQAGKRQGRMREKYYADVGAWFFSDSENKQIPSPYVPVIQFLEELKRLNILRSGASDHLFYVQQNDLAVAQERRLQQRRAIEVENAKRREEAERLAQVAAEEREKKRIADRAEQEKLRKIDAELAHHRIQTRIKRITEEVLELYQSGCNVGFRCNYCSSIKDRCDQACEYCGKSHFEPVEIDKAFVDTLEHRLLCDPRVGR
ncbi:hypothetical protein IOQ59_00065 [Pontibacterium sp. N1Y112]|uniref:Competence protein CoiA-like family protein n=1 Tax=Pontibacterium sinense TaxID=2781979 RepID=A0A8J7FJ14_9GAMM|nr:hypothetical protein [Pontibacterium sinense]MBE9395652.1 hypothetical protein [Pontibacterium sinense]